MEIVETVQEESAATVINLDEIMESSVAVLDARKSVLIELVAKHTGLTIKGVEDTEGYKAVHSARMALRNERVKLEKDGKALRENAVKFQKKVIERVNDLTAIISPLEDEFEQMEKVIDQEKEMLRQQAEALEAKKTQDRLNALNQYNFSHDWVEVKHMTDEQFDELVAHAKELHEADLKRQTELKAEEERQRQEENQRLQREREELEKRDREFKAEQERIRAEQDARERAIRESQEKLERDQREREEYMRKQEEEKKQWLAGEQKRIEEERRKFEAEKLAEQTRKETEARLAREEQERVEREALEKTEREERERQEVIRQEALRPDKEKLLAYADSIAELPFPALKAVEARDVVSDAVNRLARLAKDIRNQTQTL